MINIDLKCNMRHQRKEDKMALLQIIGLNKSYNKKKVIVDLSFELQSGEIMGLIGQNGSGKTTIFKAILGLVKKDSGQIKINEKLIEVKSKNYLDTIGTIIEYPTFYETLTARQNLMLIANLYDGIRLSKENILEALHTVGLGNSANSKVSGFSLGMKQRLGLAQAMIHHPTILLLDEPFNGLDPKGIKEFRELLIELSQRGVGIVISSHSLEELSKLVDTVTIINKGRVIFQGGKKEFLALGNKKDIWLLKTDNMKLTKSILNNLNIVFLEKPEQFELSFNTELMKASKDMLLTELIRQGVSIIYFSEKQDNFEDVFLKIQTEMEE